MTVLIGVDAGGTHTEAGIRSSGSEDIARFSAGPGFLTAARVAESSVEIMRAVAGAFGKRDVRRGDTMVVGVAGGGGADERRALHAALMRRHVATTVRITTDAELFLESAFPSGPGIVIVAGTGSIAMAKDADGVVQRVGGHGYRFGDEGSAYAIGSAAARAVLQAADGRGPQTVLSDLLSIEVGVKTLADLTEWFRSANRAAVAGLAPVITLASQAGDVVATDIITRSSRDLARHVRALSRGLSRVGKIPVAMSGGLLRHPTPLREQLVRDIKKTVPRAQPTTKSVDPITGALHIADRIASQSMS